MSCRPVACLLRLHLRLHLADMSLTHLLILGHDMYGPLHQIMGTEATLTSNPQMFLTMADLVQRRNFYFWRES